jgi:hypothetical protein
MLPTIYQKASPITYMLEKIGENGGSFSQINLDKTNPDLDKN